MIETFGCGAVEKQARRLITSNNHGLATCLVYNLGMDNIVSVS